MRQIKKTLEKFYKEAKEDYKKELREVFEKQMNKEKFPLYGRWKSLEEINEFLKTVTRKDFIILVELIILFAILLIIDNFIFIFFKWFFLPK